MMDKIASDAYSQGAYEALQQMNVPGRIKQAAAQYLTKESGVAMDALRGGGSRIMDALRSAGGIRKTKSNEAVLKAFTDGGANPSASRLINPFRNEAGAVDMLRNRRLHDALIVGGLGTAGAGGIYGANELLSDDEGLSQAQMIALGLGGAGALAGGAYAANQAGLI
jgi:hypothetical protein